ncbi:hypothetical protein OROMI_003883 [Orobanche minor]
MKGGNSKADSEKTDSRHHVEAHKQLPPSHSAMESLCQSAAASVPGAANKQMNMEAERKGRRALSDIGNLGKMQCPQHASLDEL